LIKIIGVVETVDWKLRYFCEDLDDKLLLVGLLNNMT